MDAQAVMKAGNAWAAKKLVEDVLRPPGPLERLVTAGIHRHNVDVWAKWLAGHRSFWGAL